MFDSHSISRSKGINVLLVEDDPADVEFTRETLEDIKILIHLDVAIDGAEAMKYLRKEGTYANVPRPDVIILDLNLPKKDGREVLEDIKQDEDLKSIPVVILTTSSAEEDIRRTYNDGANCYITKPIGFEQFAQVVKAIENFWFSIVKLPIK